MWADFDVVGGWDKERTPLFNCEDTNNFYVIENPNGKKSKALAATPGLALSQVLENDENFRSNGLFAFETVMLAVVGNDVYRLDTNLSALSVGTLAESIGYVSMAANNGGQILLVDEANGYIYDIISQILTLITDTDFPPSPTMAAYLDGYFIVSQGGTNTFVLSAPNDGTIWNSSGNAEYATANYQPGVIVGLAVVNGRLFLFQSTSIEVWYNAGASDFPFRRDNNALYNYGCAAVSSIASSQDVLFWLSLNKNGNYQIMMTDGGTPKPISTPAIDYLIKNMVSPTDVDSLLRRGEDGHLFYQINWTTDNLTLVYDSTMGLWHRMSMIQYHVMDEELEQQKTRHLANSHAFFQNKHFIGSYKSDNLYEMSLNFTNNAGEPIIRERTFRHFSQSTYRAIQIDSLQLDFQTGIGNTSGIYRFPGAYLSVSRDKGLTFGNEMRCALGALARTNTRCIWRQLGVHYDFVAKVKVYADVPNIYLLGGAIDSVGLNV